MRLVYAKTPPGWLTATTHWYRAKVVHLYGFNRSARFQMVASEKRCVIQTFGQPMTLLSQTWFSLESTPPSCATPSVQLLGARATLRANSPINRFRFLEFGNDYLLKIVQ